MTENIPNLALAGYRSFGKVPQYFDRFAKINLLIGRNNAGKSNVLRFLDEVYSHLWENETLKLDALANHLPDKPQLRIGAGVVVSGGDGVDPMLGNDHPILQGVQGDNQRKDAGRILSNLIREKARIDRTRLCWSLMSLPDRANHFDSWSKAFETLSDQDAYELWHLLTQRGRGGRKEHWEPEVIRLLAPKVSKVVVQVIPAIRRIGPKGSSSGTFDGTGIIERIARLQNPDVHSQTDRNRFNDISGFLQNVIGDDEATIEIPFERDTILVHMDGKVLPVESLGSGIHEVIILAAAATVLSETVVCIEEPELHLNPILQKKLLRYLSSSTSNQYFISTHSAALMDVPEIEIYHVRLENRASIVERVTSDVKKTRVCEDLGYHPSDLLQSNCVIWVEGPSDRIYINRWIRAKAPELVEGIHYSVMFYGGRLASHVTFEDLSSHVDDFITLRRLNQRGAIVLDSDRDKPRASVNQTKKRLIAEFNTGPGHAWVTAGREIENYIAPDQLREAVTKLCPAAAMPSTLGRFDNCLKLKTRSRMEKQAPKVDVAKYVTGQFVPDFSILDLDKQVTEMVEFIRRSNQQLGQ